MAGPQPQPYEDDQRARELYRYFQPDNPALLPLHSHAAVSNGSSSKASPNLVLTALAQLAAIRLGAQRAIISLIDRETLYVVAEASRSLNLGNTDVYEDDGDGLWMGCSHGPVAGTLCEKTITMKSTLENTYPLFVVNDLRKHSIYRNIPCVCGPPYFRFYAGTPLRSRNGVNIGSIYVIDPHPDLPLTPSHNEILGSIADAVMEYLETSRQSYEGSRLSKVLSGLNAFVQEETSEETSDALHERHSSSGRAQTRMPSPREPLDKVELEKLDSHSRTDGTSVQSLGTANEASGVDNSRLADDTLADFATFQRAANIMRESLDLGQDGGVVIFDSSEHSELELQDGSDEDKERKLARIRAISSSFNNSERFLNFPLASSLELRFTRQMLHRYPHGGLWYFHQDGTAFSSDDAVSPKGGRDPPDSSMSQQQSIDPRSYGNLREKDLQTLKKCFPNATRIIFAPLWDPFNSRWFGGCFCWSSMETRVFSAHVELGGVFGFGSSLMVQHSRAESQESDRKKGDFISSISHELRSPLHGILAATQFLPEHIVSEQGKPLLETIRACGHTLLDTFEQILDYSKINSFERGRQSPRSPRGMRKREVKHMSRPHSLRILKVANVAAIVEEVMESVYYGQMFSNNFSSKNWLLSASGEEQTNFSKLESVDQVDVFIDIAPFDWEFSIEPGAVRRIVMNVFGNALKYTQKGHVSVRLEVQKKSNGLKSATSSDMAGSEILLLTVSDTGRGISNEYLRSNIFTPFSQEDSLSPGTGLGLSLVRSILRSLHGNIEIKSQVGSGTVVKVILPVARPQHEPSIIPSLVSNRESVDAIRRVRVQMEGKSLCLIPDGQATNDNPSSLHTIKEYLTRWFGLILHDRDPGFSRETLILIKESQLDLLPTSLGQSLVLVLCGQGSRLLSEKFGDQKMLARNIWITLPCGPYRLARTLSDFFESANVNTTTPFFEEDSPLPPALMNEHSDDMRQTRQALADRTATPSSLPDSTPVISLKLDLGVGARVANYTSHTKAESLVNQDPNTTSIKAAKSGIRVLLVEDNLINLALLKKFMARKRPQVLHTAGNGEIAVQKVQEMTKGYHFILMDLSMPVMDGFEATVVIRSIERDRQTPRPSTIIALTGLGSLEHIKKAYAAGVNEFLTKPVSFTDIDKLMEAATVED